NLGGTDAGSAHVFLRTGTTWSEEVGLISGPAGIRFGSAVALAADGSRALVGIPFADGAGTDSGSAVIWRRSGTHWDEEGSLPASGLAAGDHFGSSVSLSADGSRALVGAPDDDTAAGSTVGSAQVFVRSGTTWSQEAALLASDGVAFDSFATSVSLSA